VNITPKMFSSQDESIEAVSTGKADIVTISSKNVYSSFPVYGWLQVPGLINGKDNAEIYKQMLWLTLTPR